MKSLKIKLVIVLLVLFTVRNFTKCQPYQFKRVVHTTLLQCGAGFSYGVGETLTHHHSTSVFKDTKPRSFFGPMSWERKYKNYPQDARAAFLGAKNVFSFVTDGYHASRTLRNTLDNISIVTYQPPPKKWHKVLDFVILQAGYSGGFHLSQMILRQ